MWALCVLPNGSMAAEQAKPCNLKAFAEVYIEAKNAPDETKELAIAELKKARAKMVEHDDAACSIHLTSASDMVAAK